MKWALVACAATACLLASACAQPLGCDGNEQCDDGLYCEVNSHICRRCLSCDELKREPLLDLKCIKSLADCGSCFAGLVENLRTLECVPPDAHDVSGIPAYVWVIVCIVSLLLLALVAFVVTHLLRNTDTLKILASTRASVQSPCGAGAGLSGAAASAPDPPPPYNAHYTAVRPASPPAAHAGDQRQDDVYHSEESSSPFIKRAPSGYGAAQGGARESAGSQAARVYNNPHYVRAPQLPPGYDGASAAASDDERDALAHDEDTMESTWTPSDAHNDESEVAAGDLSSQLEAARGTALVRAPLAHPPCGWQDSNNNRAAGEAASGAATSSGAPVFLINVMQTFNAAQPPPHQPGC